MRKTFLKSAGLCLAIFTLTACSGTDEAAVEVPSEPGKYLRIGRDSVEIIVVRPGEVFTDIGKSVAGKWVFEKCGEAYIQSGSNKLARGVFIPHVPLGCLFQQYAYYTELK